VRLSVGTGADPDWYANVTALSSLATYEGADHWVDHPYRAGVALIGDAAAACDPSWGQGMAQTLRDARVLRDCLLAETDWEKAGHAYAQEHDRYFDAVHRVEDWFTRLILEVGPEADVRRARAFPLLAEDPRRMPDTFWSGPEMPADESTRQRFFGEI
jgi:menaquinone-9 beta-reductase